MEMPGTLGRRAAAACEPALLDVGVAVAVVTGCLLAGGWHAAAARLTDWRAWAAGAVAFALIVLRRHRPVSILAVSVILAGAGTIARSQRDGFAAAAVIAVYTVSSRASGRLAWLAAGATAVALYGSGIIWTTGGLLGANLAIVAWIGMAAALGETMGTRRAYLETVEERARRAEQTRMQEARRQVAEERLRIARDLHDVLGHHIAVINMHAGLANHTVRSNPGKAEESLAHVLHAAQGVLGELATILTVLRQGDDDAPTEPVPGLSRLGELLESVTTAGLRVGYEQAGQPRPLPSAIDQSAYRIVQEALTNARKHGTGPAAQLRIEYTADALIVDVTNPAHADGTGTGHGLTGMRERALAVGGTFTAQRTPSSQFHLTAVLPTAASQEDVHAHPGPHRR